MIEPTNETIGHLTTRGYSVAAHAYFRAGLPPKYTVIAKHGETGRTAQGWSRGGDVHDAFRDLIRQLGQADDS